MNSKTGGNRGPWRVAALAVAAAVAVLTTACGVVHVHFGSSGGSASTGSAAYRAELAYAQCIRAHGLPGFPNPPHPSGGLSVHYQVNANPNSPAARANAACMHLLHGGSTGLRRRAPREGSSRILARNAVARSRNPFRRTG
jgi:hypothetical protein